MTCSTCQNCITTESSISRTMSVDLYHCMIQDLPVETTDHCEDWCEKLEA